MYHHRAGKQRQSNKGHKAGVASKRSVNKENHGRVERPGGGGAVAPAPAAADGRRGVKSTHGLAAQGKANRVNHARQLKEARRAELLVSRRLGGGGSGPPKFVVAVALGPGADCAAVAGALVRAADGGAAAPVDGDAIAAPLALTFAALRARLLLAVAPRGGDVAPAAGDRPALRLDVTHTLAAARSADVLLLVLNVGGAGGFEAGVDVEGDLFMTCLKATGVPTIVGIVQGLDALPPARVADARRWAARFFATEWGPDARVVEASGGGGEKARGAAATATAAAAGSALALARAVTAAPPKAVTWRSQRSYFVAQAAAFEEPALHSSADDGTAGRLLTLTGHLRGRPLNVHQLMLLPGAGVFAIDRVEAVAGGVGADPCFGAPRVATAAAASAPGSDVAAAAPAAPAGNSVWRPLLARLDPAVAAGVRRLRVLAPPVPLRDDGAADAGAGASAGAAAGPRAAGARAVTLVRPTDAFREPLAVVADVDADAAMAAEQTWPDEDDGEGGEDDDVDVDGGGDDDDEGYDGEDGDDAAGRARRVLDPKTPAERAARDAQIRAEALAAREKQRDRRRRRKLEGEGGSDEDEDEGDEEGAGSGAAGRTTAAASVVDGDGDADLGDVDDEEATPAAAAAAAAARRAAAAKEQVMFPDEVEAPFDMPARERFARYRGLKSLRTSPWDAKESLPPAYARIFALQRFAVAQRRVLSEAALADRALRTLEAAKLEVERAAKRGKRAGAAGRASAGRHSDAAADGGSGAASAVGGGDMDDDDDDEGDVGGVTHDADGDGDAEMAAAGDGTAPAAAPAAASTSTTADAPRRPRYATLADVLGAGWVASGQLVRVTLRGVSPAALAACTAPGVPLVPLALLRHEQRTSVAHFNITRVATAAGDGIDMPIKCRDALEFHVGPRVFDARPLFSQPAGSGGGNAGAARNKLDRFLLPGRWATATAFAPVAFGPMPVLVFRRVPVPAPADGGDAAAAAAAAVAAVTVPGPSDLDAVYPAPDTLDLSAAARAGGGRGCRLELVAVGSSEGADPDTAVLKKAVLSGYPIRVKNRFAVVRYMFFNPGDVAYFRPLEVFTKHGCVGSIREAVGTHGSMKCIFDRPISQQDTVCLPLYKRVFPRWGRAYAAAVGRDAEAAATAAFRRGAL